MNIIGITGKAGSGKDTIATYLFNKYANVYTESFAEPLKRACSAAFGIPIENFHDTEIKELNDDFWGISPRKIAQFVGTEMFRDQAGTLLGTHNSNFWIQRMGGLLAGIIETSDGAIYTQEDTIIIPDLRFQNEYDFITQQKGWVFHVVKSGTMEVGFYGHSSEAGIETQTENTWLISNNGTLEELYEQVESALTAFQIPLFTSTLTPRI